MSRDRVTVTARTGFGGRIKSAFGALLAALVIFPASLFTLWWNEANLIREKAALGEMSKQLVEARSEEIDSALEGKLIRASGELTPTTPAQDPSFLKPGQYLVLERNVEMYQWVERSESETKEKIGGSSETTTTYAYSKEWKRDRVDSGSFHERSGHENPALDFESETFRAKNATFGAYDGSRLAEKISASERLAITSELLANPSLKIEGNYIMARRMGGSSPAVGDVRVSYEAARPGRYSALGVQKSRSIQPFTASNGHTKLLVEQGERTGAELIASDLAGSKALAWLLRVLGFLFCWLSLSMLFTPFTTLLAVLPPLASLGRLGVGIVTFFFAAFFSILTIVLSIIVHNIFALLIAVVVGVGVIYMFMMKRPAKV